MLIRGSIVIFLSGLVIGFTVFSIKDSSISVASLVSSDFAQADSSEAGQVLGIQEVSQMVNQASNNLKSASSPITSAVYPQDHNLPENKDKTIKIQAKINEESLDSFDYAVEAKAAAALDSKNNIFLFQQDADEVRSIASITKLMTPLVFLDNNPGWEEVYIIKDEDRRLGGKIYLFTGEEVKVRHLFNLGLVASANTATVALVSSTGLSEAEFVAKMNDKARQLRLEKTHFDDPVGLSNYNVSTAKEIAILARAALAKEDISQATLNENYKFTTESGKAKSAPTTDYLLEHFPQNGIKIIGGKTGRTEAAGYCFVGEFSDHFGNRIISVVLGGDDNNSRFEETKKLVGWVYDSYRW